MAPEGGWQPLFWNAFKRSRNAMALLDERRCHVEVNGAYLRLFGYPREALMGRPVYEFLVGGPTMSAERFSNRPWNSGRSNTSGVAAPALIAPSNCR